MSTEITGLEPIKMNILSVSVKILLNKVTRNES